MPTYDAHYDRPTLVIVLDTEGAEIARATMTRFFANEYMKHIDGSVLVLGPEFGGKFNRYIPMHRIAEIQVER